MSYPCTKCGACCRRAGMVRLPVDERGWCLDLNEDGTCSIYETRPDVCRIDVMSKINFPNSTLDEYYAVAAEICNTWITEDKMPEEYLVQLGD